MGFRQLRMFGNVDWYEVLGYDDVRVVRSYQSSLTDGIP